MQSCRSGAQRRLVPRRHRGYRLIRLIVVSALLVSFVGGGLADAQSIDEMRARAESVQSELQQAREEIETYAEAYNRAMAEVAEADAETERAAARLAAIRVDLDARRRELADYAVSAYVQGGGLSNLDEVLESEPTKAGERLSYLKSATGDRKLAVDRLRTAQEDVERFQVQVDAAKALAAERSGAAQALRGAAEQAERDHRDVLDGLDAEIAELVRQEDARAQAAEQAAAEVAARTQTLSARPLAGAAAGDNDPILAEEPATAPTRATVASVRPPSPGGIRPAAAIAMDAAYSVIGIPYVWAGASPSQGFDCSGLVQWVWAKAGRSMSHAADWQRDESEPISESELEPGDLVFYGEPPSHVAIYAGGGQIINAPYTGEYVRVQSMYYSSKPMTFGRVN